MSDSQREAYIEALAEVLIEQAGEDARDFVDDDRVDWLAGDAER